MFFPLNISDFSLIWSYKKKEIAVQLLNSELRRTAMNYSKESPSIFVRYQYDEITIQNVNEVRKTFHERCPRDILASEMGPSCTRNDQISHFKKVYIQFNDFKAS